MPKAIEDRITATPETSGRKVGRRALALGGGAFASVGLIAGAAASVADDEPAQAASAAISERWAQYRVAADATEKADAVAWSLRCQLVARWGEQGMHQCADRPRLAALNHESDRCLDVECDCLNDLMAYPSASVPDLAVKLAALLEVWRQHKDIQGHHNQIAFGFMQEAERVLGPLVPPVPVAWEA